VVVLLYNAGGHGASYKCSASGLLGSIVLICGGGGGGGGDGG
jgi:hypothetical protein